MSKTHGGFTMPGESGYEELTLHLAEKWGADVIRDSDGTKLSPEIVNAGYGIYSTVCVIRDHNEWAKENHDKLQQTFLMSLPVISEGMLVEIELLKGYFKEQFLVNDSEDSLTYWQVFDRTTNEEIVDWTYSNGIVRIENAKPWHKYTVNFLAYRIWEEISMYNHITNNWDTEHLMQIDPIYPETREYLKNWMKEWCEEHPKTTVVRFTSMFYNFVWIWGDCERNRNLYTDWSSYDFTVSPLALSLFEKKYGYRITSEDFINKGNLNATHMPCGKEKIDWMEFVNGFVIEFGKELIDIVHSYGKKAYVFYDDSWVGIEPWGKRFGEFGFDGLIKCVFSGFEARLCAGVAGVETHEIRLHPYLFPVGLGGAPTFMEGGNPTLDAKGFWKNVRRALLRDKIDRIGLGGYLSLTIPFPDFQDYIERISDEFREIRKLHEEGKPYVLKPKVAILTFWGKLRSWTCAGHYHEHPDLDLLNIIEAISGMPFDVEFISFEEVTSEKLKQFDVIINAGIKGSAWSGGDKWKQERIVDYLTEWVARGGMFIGVNEPSATCGYDTEMRMSHILGVDIDTGAKACHGRYLFDVKCNNIVCDGTYIHKKSNVYICDAETEVLMAEDEAPLLTSHKFFKGTGIYLSGFKHNIENDRTLFNIILSSKENDGRYITDNYKTECSYYPDNKKLVIINNSDEIQKTTVKTERENITEVVEAFGIKIINLQ